MDKSKLPDGWIIRRSTHYPDKQYYFNTKTKESTWKLPVSAEQTGKQVKAVSGKHASAHGVAGKKNALFLPRQIQPVTRPLPGLPKTPKAEVGNSKTSEQPVQSGKTNSTSIQLRWSATALSAQRQKKLATPGGIFDQKPAKAESDVKLKPSAPTQKVPVIHMTGTRPLKKSVEPTASVTPAPQSKSYSQDVSSSNTLKLSVSVRETDKAISRQSDPLATEKHAPHKKSKKRKKHSKPSKDERSLKETNNKAEDKIHPGSKRKTDQDEEDCIELSLYKEDEDYLEPKRKLLRRSEENGDVQSNRANSSSSSEQKTQSSRRRSHPSLRDSLTSSTPGDPELKQNSFGKAESKNLFSFSLKESACDSNENSGVSLGDGKEFQSWMNNSAFFAGIGENTLAASSFTSAQDVNHNANISDEMDMEVDDVPAQQKPGSQNAPLEKMDEGEFLSSVTEEKYKAAAESGKRMIMVIDTSAMMDDLEKIKAVLDIDFPDFGLPILVIPWVVVQELDAIKDNKRKVEPVMGPKQIKARQAVRFVSKCFERRHPRFVGQPAKEAKEEFADLIVINNDDKILQCCLQCQNRNPQSCVLLLTKDINLCNKAAILGFDNYTPEKYPAESLSLHDKEKSSQDIIPQAPMLNFEQNLKTPDGVCKEFTLSFDQNNKTPEKLCQATNKRKRRKKRKKRGANLPAVSVGQDGKSDMAAFVKPSAEGRPTPVSETPAKRRRESSPDVYVEIADNVNCKLKSVLKAALSPIVEKEMKTVYGDLWEKIILRKKPWTGVDVVENINKHFRAVFGYVLDRSMESRMKALVQLLKNSSCKTPDVQEMVTVSTDLLMEFAKTPSYTEQLRPYLGQLRDLRNLLEPEEKPTPSPYPSPSLPTSCASSFPLTPHTTPSLPPFVSPSLARAVFPNSDPSSVPTPSPTPTPHPFATPAPFNTPTPVLRSTSSPALPGTAASNLANSSANKKLVEAKFQLVWEVIHSFCAVAKTMMGSGGQATPSTPEQQQMLRKLPVLLPLLQPLYQTYALSLSSGEEMVQRRLCCMLNQFCSELDIVNCNDSALSPEWLVQYLSSPTTRLTLETGLKQLEDMITSLGQFSSALGLSL